jgi:hypothetical protein
VSDHGEPDAVLQGHQHIMYQLILLLVGPARLHQQRTPLIEFKEIINTLVDTTCYLLDTDQSIFVQVI